MARYAARGVALTGVASYGLPTSDGWLGAFTGIIPNMRGLNMIRNIAGHDEAFMRLNR